MAVALCAIKSGIPYLLRVPSLMKRILVAATVAVTLFAPASAKALGSRSYDFCGGQYTGYTGFAFCASVTVGVAASTYTPGAYTVTLDVMNLSGQNGSYAGSLFAQIGAFVVKGLA